MPNERYISADSRWSPLGDRAVVIDTVNGERIFGAPVWMDLDEANAAADRVRDLLNEMEAEHMVTYNATAAQMREYELDRMAERMDGEMGVLAAPDTYANGQRGTKCPHCGSEHITAGRTEPEGSSGMSQSVECDDCGASWVESYMLVGYDHLERGHREEVSP